MHVLSGGRAGVARGRVPSPARDAQSDAGYTGGVLQNYRMVNKPWNMFYHPMSGQLSTPAAYDVTKELEVQIQVGSKLYPEYPIRALTEQFSNFANVWEHTLAPFTALPFYQQCTGHDTSSLGLMPKKFLKLVTQDSILRMAT